MRFIFDDVDDSLVVQIQEGVPVANTKALANGRVLGLDANGSPVGLKLVGVQARWPLTQVFFTAIAAEIARLMPDA